MNTKHTVSGYVQPERGLTLEDVGRGICTYRKREGLTQSELGKLLSMDKSQISKMEKGGNPTVSAIRKAFMAMGADVHLVVTPTAATKPAGFIDDLVETIWEFASIHGLSAKQAFNYLDRFGGIDFYFADPELEKELPVNDTMEALEKICKRNGGLI